MGLWVYFYLWFRDIHTRPCAMKDMRIAGKQRHVKSDCVEMERFALYHQNSCSRGALGDRRRRGDKRLSNGLSKLGDWRHRLGNDSWTTKSGF